MNAKPNAKKGNFSSRHRARRGLLSSTFKKVAVYAAGVGMWVSSLSVRAQDISLKQTQISVNDHHHQVAHQQPTATDAGTAFFMAGMDKDTSPEAREDILKLREQFSKTALGQSLLEFADNHGIGIYRSKSLDAHTDIGGQYHADENEIYISRNSSRSAQMMSLAHEIRHAWQEENMQYTKFLNAPLTPKQQWVLTSFIEADAFAFSSYYMAERIKDGEITNFTLEERWGPLAESAFDIADKLKKGGMTLDQYRIDVLEFHFGNLPTYYPEKLMEGLDRTLTAMEKALTQGESALAKGHKGLAEVYARQVSHHFARRPSDQQFFKALRVLGGVDLDKSKPTSLSNIPYNMLMDYYADIQVEKSNLVTDKLLSKRDALIEKHKTVEQRMVALRANLGLSPNPPKKDPHLKI